jgi:mRNA interferase HigB
MRILSRPALRAFSGRHPDAEPALSAWWSIVKHARYGVPADLKRDFATASFIGGTKTVFNISGNKYRLVADVRYDLGRVYIRAILSHAEYTRRSRDGTL